MLPTMCAVAHAAIASLCAWPVGDYHTDTEDHTELKMTDARGESDDEVDGRHG